tara:strand:+ start:5920 stop:6249 length:330 start_codon:yes stop_codon:yes gene_type:complete
MMPDWNDDPRFWDSLDNLVSVSWKPLKELIDILSETDDLPLQTKALLMGGLGTFTRIYATRRSESNPPPMAFQSAVESVYSNQHVKALMGQAADAMVDSKIEVMKEGSE